MGRRNFIIVLASMFISMLGMNIVAPFFPIYASKMHVNSLGIGMVQGAFSLSGIITLLFVGRLSDKLGRKPFLVAGLVILGFSSVGLMFADRPLHLILLRLAQGFGASTYLSISQACLGDAVASGKEGKWLGLFNAVLFAGMGAGPLVGGVMADFFSIKTAFLSLAVMIFISLIVLSLFFEERPRRVAVNEQASFTAPLRSSILKGVFGYRLGIGVCTATLMAFVPLFAGLRIGLSGSLIGALMAARIPIAFSQSYTGQLADTWDRRKMVLGRGGLCLITVALMPFSRGFLALLICYLLVTISQAVGMPAANTYVVQEGRTYGMGVSVTMFMMAMYIGNSLGPVALGGIADKLGLEYAFYSASLCMAVGVALFAWKVK
jgi:MFS transporter, DHA1 family, multidrug resistance protein